MSATPSVWTEPRRVAAEPLPCEGRGTPLPCERRGVHACDSEHATGPCENDTAAARRGSVHARNGLDSYSNGDAASLSRRSRRRRRDAASTVTARQCRKNQLCIGVYLDETVFCRAWRYAVNAMKQLPICVLLGAPLLGVGALFGLAASRLRLRLRRDKPAAGLFGL
jgi:hypothetical protein